MTNLDQEKFNDLSQSIFDRLLPLTAANNAHTRLLSYYFVHKFIETRKNDKKISNLSIQIKASIDKMLQS